jgi:hypothetical protein
VRHQRGQLLTLADILEFRVENVNVLDYWEYGVVTLSPSTPSYGDSYISGYSIWGPPNDTTNVAHIVVTSGAGLRVVNSKLNTGNGLTDSGILPAAAAGLGAGTTYPEPALMISGSSIEGPAAGLNVPNAAPAHNSVAGAVICGNQVFAGQNAVRVNPGGSALWFDTFAITGNLFLVAQERGQGVVAIDNARIGTIVGNTFALAPPPSGSPPYPPAVVLGANAYAPAFATGAQHYQSASGTNTHATTTNGPASPRRPCRGPAAAREGPVPGGAGRVRFGPKLGGISILSPNDARARGRGPRTPAPGPGGADGPDPADVSGHRPPYSREPVVSDRAALLSGCLEAPARGTSSWLGSTGWRIPREGS